MRVQFLLRPYPVLSSALWRALPALLLLLGLSGCGEPDMPRHRHSEMGRSGDDGEHPAPRVMPHMEAHGVFFAGQIEVECLLAPSGVRWAPRDTEGRRNPRGGELGGGFGMRGEGGMGGGGMGGGMGGGPRGGGMGGGDFDGPRSTIHPSHEPPVQLRLRLTNRANTPAVVEVLDFNSAIGNFVVQPAKLTVPPGGSVEADPMNSSLGIPADEIPVTVRLLLDGHKETQVLLLKLATPPAAAP